MKQIFFFIGVCLLLQSTGNAKDQQQDSIQYIIEYTLTHIVDTTQPDFPVNRNYILLVGKQRSWYDQRVIAMEYIGRPEMVSFQDNTGVVRTGKASGIRDAYYKDFGTQKMNNEKPLGSTLYSIQESLPSIEWTLWQEQKVIANYNCQKATARYKGRDYTAWFTNELPFPSGPWKLGGLPGLILEAYDQKKEVVFTFVSFLPLSEGLKPLGPDEKSRIVTLEEYKKTKLALEKDANAMKGAGMTNLSGFTSGSVTATSAIDFRSRVFNNPIEKEE